jgi:predicted transposase YbfD/YdcC
MVSAWAQQNSLILGQVKVDEKSNEITAIPKLLSQLDIAGAVITMDAMGCQKKNSQTHYGKESGLYSQFERKSGELTR